MKISGMKRVFHRCRDPAETCDPDLPDMPALVA
jgi:hypothetical protein